MAVGNNTVGAAAVGDATADAQVTITATNSPIAAGEPLRVEVNVTNEGFVPATGELTLTVSEQ